MKQQTLVAATMRTAKDQIRDLLNEGWLMVPESLKIHAPANHPAYEIYLVVILEKEAS